MTAPDRIWINKVYGQHPDDWDFTDGEYLTKAQLRQKVEYVRLDPAVLAALSEVKALIEEAVWAVAQVADKELERWGFSSGPDGFGRRAEMRNVIVEELPSIKAVRIEMAKAKGADHE